MSQLQSTKAVCSAPTYLVALMWPKSHVPVPHLSIAKVKMGDSSWGVMRSRKVGVPIAKEGVNCQYDLPVSSEARVKYPGLLTSRCVV